MVLDLCVYIVVFTMTSIMAFIFQRTYHGIRFQGISYAGNNMSTLVYCMEGCIFLFPIIAMYGLRYGIGTDYFAYQGFHDVLHYASFMEYWIGHANSTGAFYVEPGYYFLNRVFPSYRWLLWGTGVLIVSLILLAVKDYKSRISFAFALFIYLSTQYIYSMNGVRFAVALCFALLGYKELSKNHTVNFVIMVVLAALFHKVAIFCLVMYFLKEYKHKELNLTRNIVLFISIVLFPVISSYLFRIIGSFQAFERYFSVAHYSPGETINGGWTWLLHVLPVIFPLMMFCKKEIFDAEDTGTLFRICIMEVPFRMLGLYNTWYTRFARLSQIVEVIFIPLVLSKIKSKQKKRILYIYYIAWFIFYFAYYAIVNDRGDSLPYVWIFSH